MRCVYPQPAAQRVLMHSESAEAAASGRAPPAPPPPPAPATTTHQCTLPNPAPAFHLICISSCFNRCHLLPIINRTHLLLRIVQRALRPLGENLGEAEDAVELRWVGVGRGWV